jgi:FRG domain
MIKQCGPVSTLNELLECTKELRQDWPPSEKPTRTGEQQNLWFRGQPSAKWGLSPKLYRNEYRGSQEAEIRQDFQSRALQLMQGRIPSRDDKWEWYFLMQHYGVPTRLLDWTDNALIALYFAVNDQPAPDDSAVWVLDPWWLNRQLVKQIDGPMLPGWEEAEPYLWDLEYAFTRDVDVRVEKPAAIDPPHVDRRLAAQKSRFLIFGKAKNFTSTKVVRKTGSRLAKIVIPQSRIEPIRRELENCGVTVSAVFPDLEHLGQEIRALWRKF